MGDSWKGVAYLVDVSLPCLGQYDVCSSAGEGKLFGASLCTFIRVIEVVLCLKSERIRQSSLLGICEMFFVIAVGYIHYYLYNE